MKLLVDIGNTLIKFAIFESDEMIYKSSLENFSEVNFNEIIKKYNISSAIISSVRKNNDELLKFVSSKLPFIFLDQNTKLPIKNNYLSKDTLGKDRLAAVVGASILYPNKNVLVIDAGTCITYDFISSDKIYYGGAISPGLNMRLKSLNTFTSQLPLVTLQENTIPNLTGNTTNTSILSGVIRGFAGEINSIIESYSLENKNLKTIVTGGDYKYFDKLLKYKTFAAPNLVFVGLKGIMDFNEKI
ncbi:MAG: pantothenate kinase [Marinilabiliales bacterium]|nr:MAG: pantothenate kinase [Marinilabiliales bacterium]